MTFILPHRSATKNVVAFHMYPVETRKSTSHKRRGSKRIQLFRFSRLDLGELQLSDLRGVGEL